MGEKEKESERGRERGEREGKRGEKREKENLFAVFLVLGKLVSIIMYLLALSNWVTSCVCMRVYLSPCHAPPRCLMLRRLGTVLLIICGPRVNSVCRFLCSSLLDFFCIAHV